LSVRYVWTGDAEEVPPIDDRVDCSCAGGVAVLTDRVLHLTRTHKDPVPFSFGEGQGPFPFPVPRRSGGQAWGATPGPLPRRASSPVRLGDVTRPSSLSELVRTVLASGVGGCCPLAVPACMTQGRWCVAPTRVVTEETPPPAEQEGAFCVQSAPREARRAKVKSARSTHTADATSYGEVAPSKFEVEVRTKIEEFE